MLTINIHNNSQTIDTQVIPTTVDTAHIIKATPRVNYELKNTQTNHAPDRIITQRQGKDLYIFTHKMAHDPDVIIEGFYEYDDIGLIGLAENNQYYHYIPDSTEVADYVTNLADVASQAHALGGTAMSYPWWVGAQQAGFTPFLIGTLGVATAGIALKQYAKDHQESDNSSTSNPTPQPNQIGTVTISGTPKVGSTLNATVTDADGIFSTIEYQWLRNGQTISGATSSSYELTDDDINAKISIKATYIDNSQNQENPISAQTEIVVSNTTPNPQPPQDTTPPVVTISSDKSDLDTGDTAILTFNLSEMVVGFDESDIVVTGGVISHFTQSTTNPNQYTAIFTATGAGNAHISIVAGSFADLVNNINNHGAELVLNVTSPAPSPQPNQIGTVTIQGEAKVGNTLNAVVKDGNGEPDTIEYQWFADGVAIQGANQSAYHVRASDVGKALTVQARYTDKAHYLEDLISTPTAAVVDPTAPPPANHAPTGDVTITGDAEVGQTLTAANTLQDDDGLGAITYRWFADGVEVGTGDTYTLQDADKGKTITVKAEYTDGKGNAESVASQPTAAVVDPTAPQPPANQAPTDITLSANQIMENQDGAMVGTLSTTDPDANDTHTYSVSDQRFEVDAQGQLKLKAGEKLEFANEPTVTLEITTTDAAGASYTETFTLQVQDDPAYPALPPGKLGVYVPKPANNLVVSVKDFGAKGDGQTDDAAAIQAAIDHVAAQGGGIVDIPAGTYLIDNLHHKINYEYAGLLMKSNVILRMTDDTTLKALPNDSQYASMIRIQNADNAHILGGNLIGDRDTHTGKLGEWGHGIHILNATNVVVENVKSSEFWGDGFCVGRRPYPANKPEPSTENIIFYQVHADHNRRQGISIGHGKNLKILNSIFENMDGTDPRSGIDIEPYRDDHVENVEIRGNVFANNRSAFIASNHAISGNTIKNLVFADNTLRGNFGGISIIGVDGGQISGNTIHHSHAETNSMYHTHYGIRLQDGIVPTIGVTVSDNTLYGSYILNRGTHGNTIGENTYKASVYVRGVALAGQTLTAEVYEGDYAVLNPDNGSGTRIPGSGITYRWFADGVEIPGAARHTYTLTEADRGKTISVEVAFTDVAGNPEHATSTATAPIGSQNHAPTDIILSPLVVAAGLVRAEVGTLKTLDPDGGERFTYTVSDSRFEVSRDLLRLKEGQYIKPGEDNIPLTVTVQDHAGATYSETFTLTVRPYDNEPPSAITLSASELMEGKAGAEIGTLTVKDPNVGETFTYQLSDSRFEITNGTLKLKSGEKVDYATEKTITLTITATDSGGFSIRKNFTLNVQDDPAYPAPTPPNGGKLGVYVPKPATDFIANVKDVAYGAKGDGTTDDTAAIQKAIDAAAAKGGGIVDIPAGTYMVDGVKSLHLKNHVTVRMADDTVLKAQATGSGTTYHILRMTDVEHANILGGTLDGARDSQGQGVNGYGVMIYGSQNLVVENVAVKNVKTDGFYVGTSKLFPEQPENIVFYNVSADNSGRQGLKISAGDNIKVLNSTFHNANGIPGELGINIEPNDPANSPTGARQEVRHVEIRGNTFSNNTYGVMVSRSRDRDTVIEDIQIKDNRLIENDHGIRVIGITGGSISGNTVRDNGSTIPYFDIDVEKSSNVDVRDNVLYGGRLRTPQELEGSSNITMSNNSYKGAVYIRGDAKVGNTVEAEIFDGDNNGARVGNATHKWLVDGVEIAGATQSRYQITAAERGKTITVEVAYRDFQGNDETALSLPTAPVEGSGNQAPTDITLSATQIMENQKGAVVGALKTTDPDPNDTHTYSVSDQRFEVAGGELKLKADQALDFAKEPQIQLDITSTDSSGASLQKSFTLHVQDDPNYPVANGGKLGVYVPKPATDFVANVKDAAYGAKGDGQSDDTAAIQQAIDAVAEKGGGIVDIPAGTYRINGAASSVLGPGDVPRTSGLQVKSNVIIRMSDDTVMQVIPNGEKNYDIFNIYNAENVAIMGGTLQGDRHSHLNNQGEWGAGIKIASGKNVVVEKVIARDFWGDAVQISDSGSLPRTASENVTIYQLTADHNRRQGISIGFADKVLIEDSVFKNTGGQGGTPPMSGIDIEPENHEIASNITIKNSKFENNTGYGIILLERSDTTGAEVRNVTIDGNTIKTSGAGIVVNNTGGHTITNNHISDIGKGWYYGSQHALALNANSHDNTVSDNTVETGSIIDRGQNNTVSGNTFESVAFARGENKVGAVLTAEVHNDDGAPRNISYQWLADGKKIDGATAATYTVRPEDAGKHISVEASFDKDGGARETTLREVPTLPIENTANPDPNPPANGGKLGVYVPKPVTDFVTNAKDFGAKGDGQSDDTAAIQQAIDAVAEKGGGVVEIPAGTYMVNANSNRGLGGISVKSNVILRMSDDTVLKAMPNELPKDQSSVLRMVNVDNAHIIGGTVDGGRDANQGGGYGVLIYSARNAVIENVTAQNFLTDGFYLGRNKYDQPLPDNVVFYNVTADNNARQGLSITNGDNIKVIKSVFKNTEGHSLESGIDIEPNPSKDSPVVMPDGKTKVPGKVTNVEIIDSVFENNAGYGVIASANEDAVVENVRVINNRMDGNLHAITFNHVIGGEISSNTTLDNGRTIPYFDVDVYNDSQNIIVKDNTLYGGKVRTYEAGNLEGSGHQVSGNHTQAAVFIKGALKTGATVFAQPEDGNGVPLSKFIKYQWQINGKDIDGATAREYTIRPEDSGKSLSVRVEFPDGSKQTETAVSKPTPPIDSFKNNAAPTALELAGKALEVIEGKNGAVAGRVRGIDGDRGDDLSYRISDERFDIDAYGLIRLKPDEKLDYAQTQSIKVNVTAIDRAGNELSKPFTIAVKDDSNYTAPTPTPPVASRLTVENAASVYEGDALQYVIRLDAPSRAGQIVRLKTQFHNNTVPAEILSKTADPFKPGEYLANGTVFTRDVKNADVQPLANSADISQHLLSLAEQFKAHKGAYTALNREAYNIPIYIVDSSDPAQTYVQFSSDDPRVQHSQDILTHTMGRIPFPTYGIPAEGNDKSFAVYDKATGMFREYFYAEKVPDGWKVLSAGYHQAKPGLSGLEVDNFWMQLDHGGSAVVMMLNPLSQIGISELMSGRINHAVSITLPDAMKERPSFPAKLSDGQDTSPNAAAEGQWFRIKPNANLDQYTYLDAQGNNKALNPLTLMIAKAVQQYGGYGADRNRHNIAFNAESSHNYLAQGKEDPWRKGGELYRKLSADGVDNPFDINDFPWELVEWLPLDWSDKGVDAGVYADTHMTASAGGIDLLVDDNGDVILPAGVTEIRVKVPTLTHNNFIQTERVDLSVELHEGGQILAKDNGNGHVLDAPSPFEDMTSDSDNSGRDVLISHKLNLDGFANLKQMQDKEVVEYLVEHGADIFAQSKDGVTRTLRGGAGDDILVSGFGMDILEGGTGADTFVFVMDGENSQPFNGNDRIVDFNPSEDRIILTRGKDWLQTDLVEFADAPEVQRLQFKTWRHDTPPVIHINAVEIKTHDGRLLGAKEVLDALRIYTPNGVYMYDGRTVANSTNSSTNQPKDTTPPVLTISADKAALDKSGDSTRITFKLNEPVQNFAANDISVTSGRITDFQKIDNTTYTAIYTGVNSGDIRIAAGAFSDLSYNQNASSSLRIPVVSAGKVVIEGSPKIGHKLIAKVTDENGLPTDITYQWFADGNKIVGATQASYILDGADVGKTISVRATYQDNEHFSESITSSITTAVQGLDTHVFANISELMSADGLRANDKAMIVDFNNINDDIEISYIISDTLPDVSAGIINRLAVPLKDGRYALPQISDFSLPTQNSEANVDAMLQVAKTYLDAGDKLVWDGKGQTPLYVSGTPQMVKTPSGKDAFAITCSAFINMVMAGWKFEDTTYATTHNTSSYPWGIDFSDKPKGDVGPYGANNQLKWMYWKNQVALYNGKNGGEENYQVGDVLFFSKQNPEGAGTGGKFFMNVYHSAIYIGNNQVMHSAGTYHGNGVVVETISPSLKNDLTWIGRPHLGNGDITITGVPEVGQSLSTTISDIDGEPTNVQYQWLSDGQEIQGATSSTYTLIQADVGKQISVRASYVDREGRHEYPISAMTSKVLEVAPILQPQDATAPTILITAEKTTLNVGDATTLTFKLSEAVGGFDSGDITTTGGSISNFTKVSDTMYHAVFTATDVGNAGISIAAHSFVDLANNLNAQGANLALDVMAMPNQMGTVTITGTPKDGQVLTAIVMDADGLSSNITYQWLRDGQPIAGATNSTYQPQLVDIDKAISVRIMYLDDAGHDELLVSSALEITQSVNNSPTGAVTISGLAQVGYTLHAANSLQDADGMGQIEYQWLRDGQPITGATAQMYTLTSADADRQISVRASYIDGATNAESKESISSVLTAVDGTALDFDDNHGQQSFKWAGFDWVARDGDWNRGAPTASGMWSRDNVQLDGTNLVMRITNSDGHTPVASEMISTRAMGYGSYEATFRADVTQMDMYSVFGFFTYEWRSPSVAGRREIDAIELSHWGESIARAPTTYYSDDNQMYKVGGRPSYAWPEDVTYANVRMVWQPDKITWTFKNAETGETLRQVEATDNIPSVGKQQVHFNFWTYQPGDDPGGVDGWKGNATGAEQAITLEAFSYAPLSGDILPTSNQASMVAAPMFASISQHTNVFAGAPVTVGQNHLNKTMEALATPTSKQAGLNLDIARKFYSVQALKEAIDTLDNVGGAFLHLHLTDNENFAIESAILGQTVATANQQADGSYINPVTGKPFLSKVQVGEIAQYAKSKGIELIAELDMPAHTKGLFDLLYAHNPTLADDVRVTWHYTDPTTGQMVRPYQLDITNPKSLKLAKGLIDEIADSFGDSSRHFHIGGDDLTGATTATMNAEYMSFVNELNAHLNARGLTTRMWNDPVLNMSLDTLAKNIEITYHDSGYDKGERGSDLDDRASMPTLIDHGFGVYNYNGNYLYHHPKSHHYSSLSQSDSEMYTRLETWDLGKWDWGFDSTAMTDTTGIKGAVLSVWGVSAADLPDVSIIKFITPQLSAIVDMTQAAADPTSDRAQELDNISDALSQGDYSLLSHDVYVDLDIAPDGGVLDADSLGTQHIKLLLSDVLETRSGFEFHIRGDDTDTLALGDDWQATGDTKIVQSPARTFDVTDYHAYTRGDDILWVDSDIRII